MSAGEDDAALLSAVAHFLEADLRPALTDPALIFRLKIATHLLEGRARAAATQTARRSEAHTRLLAVVGEVADPEVALLERIRQEPPGDELRRYLLARTGAELAISNPRFDRRLDLEEQ